MANIWIWACLALLIPRTFGLIQPALNARADFATEFYRLYNFDLEGEQKGESLVLSPAAVQKFLTVIYGGADHVLADEMLWDMQLKRIDMDRLLKEADDAGIKDIGFTTHLKEKQLRELREHIKREDVFDYFRRDFAELGNEIKVKNFIMAEKNLILDAFFCEFAEDYFSVKTGNRGIDTTHEIEQIFGDVLNKTAQLELFSAIDFEASFKDGFTFTNNGLRARGKFRTGKIDSPYNEEFQAQVLELPLNTHANLSMLIFMPPTENFFRIMKAQVIGRSLDDFNKVSSALTEEDIEVKLPLIVLETQTNLAEYFKEYSKKGVRTLFSDPVLLHLMFENMPKSGVQVGGFWQKSHVRIGAGKESAENAVHEENSNTAPLSVFDATDKSFFFVIKSPQVLYFLGHIGHK